MGQLHNNPVVQNLIDLYDMSGHPEGGYYKETYKSIKSVKGEDRKLMTVIYFLLPGDQVSKLHRIKSDEFWFFHHGSSLTVHTLDEEGYVKHKVGNNWTEGDVAQLLVPADTIFGSSVEDENGYAFVSCVVAPGFEFDDFELLERQYLLDKFPLFEKEIQKLT